MDPVRELLRKLLVDELIAVQGSVVDMSLLEDFILASGTHRLRGQVIDVFKG